MYTTVRERLPGKQGAGSAHKEARTPLRSVLARIGPNVYFLGLVSLLTDISSEMVSSILPLYLVLGLGFSPFQFGVIDGLYNGVSAIARLIGGVAADRWRRHKEVAGIGYAVSAMAKIGLIAAGSAWGAVVAVIAADRTGKGIRTAPRDALISLSAPRDRLGTAFGIHRAMDNFGALLGPIVAFSILALLPGKFNVVFIISFMIATLGVLALVLFVQNHPSPPDAESSEKVGSQPKPSFAQAFRLLRQPRFRTLSVVAATLAALTVSDSFLYLVLYERTGMPMGVFPLLFVVTAVVYVILAVPVGRMADRFGRGRVVIGGYAVLATLYGLLLLPVGGNGLVVLVPVVLIGLASYYAATDGVLMAMASAELPERIRASGLALLTTGTAGARLASSVLFGALWVVVGRETAIVVFLVGLAVALVFAAAAIARLHVQPAEPA